MGKAITLLWGLAGAVIASGVVLWSVPHQRSAPPQHRAMLGDKEASSLLAAASGAWRPIPTAGTSSRAARCPLNEIGSCFSLHERIGSHDSHP